MERDGLPDKRKITPEKRKPKLESLGFDDLQSVYERATELARTTYTRTETGFRSAAGDIVSFRKESSGKYKLSQFPEVDSRFSTYLFSHSTETIAVGSDSLEDMMAAAVQLLEAFGNRII